jgi:hypothetical protein
LKDINDITLGDGDLVLFTKKENEFIAYGIVYDNKIISKYSIHTKLKQIYKIIQLSDREKNIKNNLLDRVKRINDANLARKELKFLSAKDQVIGNSYCTVSGEIYLYVGKCSIERYKNLFLAQAKTETVDGYGYIYIGYVNYDINYNIKCERLFTRPALENTIINSGTTSIYLNKNKKRFVKKCEYKVPVINKNFVYYAIDKSNNIYMYDKVNIKKL